MNGRSSHGHISDIATATTIKIRYGSAAYSGRVVFLVFSLVVTCNSFHNLRN
jgi:hypothetical protein